MSTAQKLTFSVVSHGHGAMLHALLNDLAQSPSLSGARVVVTLNLRDEGFQPDQYERLDIVVVRNERPKGFGANHNFAFNHCWTPWFVVLNPDLRLRGGEPFSTLTAKAVNSERVGVIAPEVINSAGFPEDAVRSNLSPLSLIRRYLHLGSEHGLKAEPDKQRQFYWLAGMCLVINSHAYKAVGGFDERFFLYCEDYDLCARLHTSGFRLVVDRSVQIVHEARRDSRRSWRHLRWHLAGLWRVWTSRVFWTIAREDLTAQRQPARVG